VLAKGFEYSTKYSCSRLADYTAWNVWSLETFQDPYMRQSIKLCEEARFEDESGLLVDQRCQLVFTNM
jgi:hypothetical protein